MSAGWVHVLPQSVLDMASTSVLFRDMMSQSVFVSVSTTGAGFPIHVPGLSFHSECTSCTSDQLTPWSLDRLKSNGQYVAINGSAWMWMRLLTGIGQKRNQHLFLTNANTRDLETLGEYASEDVVSPVIMQTLPFSAEGVQDDLHLEGENAY